MMRDKEMRCFRGHKKEVTSLAWHPFCEELFASGGGQYDGAIMFWVTRYAKNVVLYHVIVPMNHLQKHAMRMTAASGILPGIHLDIF